MITTHTRLIGSAVLAAMHVTEYRPGVHQITGDEKAWHQFARHIASLDGLQHALLNPPPVNRCEMGWWTNPALPELEEGMSFKLFCESMQLDFTMVDAEGVEADAFQAEYERTGSFLSWQPEPPPNAGWVPLSIHDTEDGPVAMYVRRRPDPNAPLTSEQVQRARLEVSHLLALVKNHGDALVAIERAGNGASVQPLADAERDLEIAFRRLVHKSMRISGSLE